MARLSHAINRLKNNEGNGLDVLELVKSPSTSQAGDGLVVTLGANATGDGIQITTSGSGPSLNIASTNARGDIHFSNRSSDPATTTEGDFWYNATTNVFKYYDGSTVQTLGTGGSGAANLDEAYDGGGSGAGRTITVDAGAVVLNQSTTTNALEISQTGIGHAIDIDVTSGGAAQAIVMSQAATASAPLVEITAASTTGGGDGVYINQTGSNNSIEIDVSNSQAQALVITATAAAGPLIQVTNDSSLNLNSLLQLNKSPGSAFGGTILEVTGGANFTGNSIDVTHSGSGGAGIMSTASGAGYAADLNSTGSLPALRVDGPAGRGAIEFVGVTSDPGTTTEGDVWYNTTDNKFRIRAGGSTETLSFESSALQGAYDNGETITLSAGLTEIVVNGDAIGAVSTDAAIGFLLANNTDAAAGAQQYSPMLVLEGQGWRTDTTAETREVQWGFQNVPVQGAANPTTYLLIQTNVNDAGWTEALRVTEDGGVVLTEQSSVPGGAPAAGQGTLWVKSDTPNVLYYTDDAGTDHNLLSVGGGGNTLDEAYDEGGPGAGRSITVDSDAVVMDNQSTTSNNTLELIRDSSSTGTTGHALDIAYATVSGSVSGSSINIDHDGTSAAAIAINHDGANGISITNDSTSSESLDIVISNVAGRGIKVTESAAGTQTMIALTRNASATGAAIDVTDPGQGVALDIGASSSVRGQIAFDGATGDPTTTTEGDLWYNASANAFKYYDGSTVQTLGTVAGAGVANLDEAYDGGGSGAGRTITVDSGAVVLNQSGTSNALEIDQDGAGDAINIELNISSAQALVASVSTATTVPMFEISKNLGASGDVMSIDRSPNVSGSGEAIDITMGANATGDGVQVNNDGTGVGVEVIQSGAGDALSVTLDSSTLAQALVITSAVNSSNPLISVDTGTGATADLVNLSNDGGGNGLVVAQSGSGDAINVTLDSDTSARGLVISESVASTSGMVVLSRNTTGASGDIIRITRLPASATSGDGINITWGSNSVGIPFRIDQDGSGSSIDINQSGAGDALNIALDSSTAAQAIVITTSVNTVSDIFTITQTTTGASDFIVLDKSPSSSAAGNAIDVTMGSNATGHGLSISHSGTGNAIDVTGDVDIDGKLTVSGLIDPTGLKLQEQASDPGSTGAGEGTIYVKNTTPSTLVFVDDTGSEVTLGAAGASNTLDGAYDEGGPGAGRTITADNDAVRITNTTSDSNNVLEVDKTPGGSGTLGNAIDVTLGANSGGYGINVTKSGGVAAFRATGTGTLLALDKTSGSGDAMQITQSVSGDAMDISLGNTAAQALVVTESTVGTQAMISLSRNASATGAAIDVADPGQGVALDIGASSSVRGQIAFDGATGDPSTTTEGDFWYNATENEFKYYNGSSVQNVGTTLDQAYDHGGAGSGRSITADSGAVTITNATSDSNNVLEVSKASTGSGTNGNAIDVSIGSNSSSLAAAISVSTVVSRGIEVTATGSGIPGRFVGHTTGTSPVVELVGQATGPALNITNSSTGNAITAAGDVEVTGTITQTAPNHASVTYTAAGTGQSGVHTIFDTTTNGGTVTTNTSNGITFSSSTGQFTVPNTGIYKVDVVAYLTQSSAGLTDAWRLVKNGSTNVWVGPDFYIQSSEDPMEVTISVYLSLSASDTVELEADSDSSSTLAAEVGTTFNILQL